MIIIYFYQLLIKLIKNNLKIFISATEQSGDNIGYNLIKEIKKTNDQIIRLHLKELVGKKCLVILISNIFH